MVCWQVLELLEHPGGSTIPQLLVKPVFTPTSYTIHLTDLSNIWSEELDLGNIIERAFQEQSPIEVSSQDTSQLAILLDNVIKSLSNSKDASCRIARNDDDGITLHTTISLPGPLESLSWKFLLKKTTSKALQDELILPLLISSHIQHQRIIALITMIADKDKAITRLVDQYEAHHLDLAAAFPMIGSLKSGKRTVRRDQAAKHVPALQPFHEAAWKEETEKFEGSQVTTLELFQEALAQSVPRVPTQLKSRDEDIEWWNMLPDRLSPLKAAAKSKKQEPPVVKPKEVVAESSEVETEDEFETHDNFKTRNILGSPEKATEPTSHSGRTSRDASEDQGAEGNEDLDAPPMSESQGRKQKSPPIPRATTPPAKKVKSKGFRIGGIARKGSPESPPPVQVRRGISSDDGTMATKDTVTLSTAGDQFGKTSSQGPRRPFKIGGKGKATKGDIEAQNDSPISQRVDDKTSIRSVVADNSTSSQPRQVTKQETPMVDTHEETPEEKAERKRTELKRKNEEAAKKQAQQKKKKRF